jgi:hypothetical protein
MAGPSAEDLLTRGLFHDRIVPPLSSRALSNVFREIVVFAEAEMAKKPDQRKRTPLVRHSVPKMKHLRRTFGIPNPYSQSMLTIAMSEHWDKLYKICEKSMISLSRPQASSKRSLTAEHSRRVEGVRRSQSSIGKRFMLKADIASYYPSIYTHSIPWAIHGKNVARSKRARNWYGNEIDKWTRETQDRQTGGIPIGPDTSFMIAEIIASRMDAELEKVIHQKLVGVRYIDDYHLYFSTRGDAEIALAALHSVTQGFELQINGPKTEILEVPEPIEPAWKTELRLIRIRSDKRATGIKAFFDRAATLAVQFPGDSVLTYAVRKVARYALRLTEREWEVCRSLLLRACLGEPTMLPAVAELFENNDEAWRYSDLQHFLNELCVYHARLQQGFEVAWGLWLARSRSIRLSDSVAAAIKKMDDDVVALVALDMEAQGLISGMNSPLWNSRMSADHLYSDHWLLAYEARVQQWLPSIDGTDYIAADPFFSILQQGGVRFYDAGDPWEEGYSDYSDGDDEDDEDEDDQDDEGDTLEDDAAEGPAE